MPLNSLETRTLWLTVWHSDMFGRNDFLGEVTINLQGIVFDNPQPQWYTLQERVSILKLFALTHTHTHVLHLQVKHPRIFRMLRLSLLLLLLSLSVL